MHRDIVIRGARQNNLKNINLNIRQNELTVLTGPSGSGKSSLAFDTLFAEGQRRFVESQTTYVRQFLQRLDKPDVDVIEGLCPTLAVQSRNAARTARSTVGTVTEIYDYLRLLFSKIGELHCPECDAPVRALGVDEMVTAARERFEGERALVLAPLEISPKLGPDVLRDLVRAHGFSYILAGGGVLDLETCDDTQLEKAISASLKAARKQGEDAHGRLHIVVDRVNVAAKKRARLADSIETALRQGAGACAVQGPEGDTLEFRQQPVCAKCGIAVSQPSPHELSFNNPLGACPSCTGFGDIYQIDMDLVIPDKNLTLRQGAIACWNGAGIKRYVKRMHAHGDEVLGVRLDVPYKDLTDEEKQRVYDGWGKHLYGLKEFFDEISRKSYKVSNRYMLMRFRTLRRCPDCGGSRLNKKALSVRLAGKNIFELGDMPLDEMLPFIDSLKIAAHQREIIKIPLREILSRARYLVEIGLGYLTLWRLSRTLSGGEMQRIHLAGALGSRLTGTLTILDEPTVGLHPRDTDRLIKVLHDIRDVGNTVLVVEHDMQVMRGADRVVDMGPGPGELGGEVVYAGEMAEFIAESQTLTAQYLRGEKRVGGRTAASAPDAWLTVRGAREHNLKKIDAAFPAGRITCVTGVSGSGKSTLVCDVLYPFMARRLNKNGDLRPGDCDDVENWDLFTAVEMVGQDPVGRTPRANPATYLDILTPIRSLFAATPEARAHHVAPGLFSFNSAAGRCPACEGTGFLKIEMQFLADIFVQCEDCGGSRYKPEALQYTYREKTIADVLRMTASEASEFFFDTQTVLRRLAPMRDVGLEYLRLGQPLNTLSAGEAQRLKIASELSASGAGRTLYLFDEPTMGLHPGEVDKLLQCFDRLTKKGHTIIIIEHNLDVIANADHIIDLGPEGGDKGGKVIFSGAPAQLMKSKKSFTGIFLKEYLAAVKKKI